MDNLYLDAYKFYKRTHANSLLLFHVGSRYEACEEDATKLSENVAIFYWRKMVLSYADSQIMKFLK